MTAAPRRGWRYPWLVACSVLTVGLSSHAPGGQGRAATEGTGLTQGAFALRVMRCAGQERHLARTDPQSDAVARLAELGFEPPRGWRPAEALTWEEAASVYGVLLAAERGSDRGERSPSSSADPPGRAGVSGPGIRIEKLASIGGLAPAPQIAWGTNGAPVRYLFVVSNATDGVLDSVTVTDPDIAPEVSTNLGWLAPMGVATVAVTRAIQSNLVNHAWVTARDRKTGAALSARDAVRVVEMTVIDLIERSARAVQTATAGTQERQPISPSRPLRR